MQRIYLDNAATTPTSPEVLAAMLPYFTDLYGNPSSIHSFGQEAKEAVEKARDRLAALLGARSDEIIFTSGGTESDNTALMGIAYALKDKGNHIITTPVEHHAIVETARFMEKQGYRVTYLPVDRYGAVSPDDVRKAITPRTILVSVMHANNEMGTIQPVTEIARVAREAGVYCHTDAVQTVGHIPLSVKELGVDLLSLSAHKFNGPKGVGALYIRKGTRLLPFAHGGEQERNLRAGTHNVPGIVGLGKAAEIAQKSLPAEMARITALRDCLTRGILDGIKNTYINGHPQSRLPGNVNISIDFVEGESVLLNLDLEGICASTGSACSSASLEPSHVLLAMGIAPEKAHCSIRFSLGAQNTGADVDRVLEALPRIVTKLRAMSPLVKPG
ncbi:MAG: cysteine desulfurase NifS [Dehalococcoidia bacterium]|nr:MAG: cysteine desulfurase NifS [Dehalococcoidia bacterium]